jgi:hypothetical protein
VPLRCCAPVLGWMDGSMEPCRINTVQNRILPLRPHAFRMRAQQEYQRENSFNAAQIYTNPFNAIKIYSFPSMPSNLNFNPLNVITVSLKLTPLVIFKANPSNAIKIYTDPFNATRNWFDLFGF